MHDDAGSSRRSAELEIDADLFSEAESLSLNVSHAAEIGIKAAIKAERERRWKEENKPAIEAWNAYVEEHGLPLAKYRQF
jgi:antitoxin CcdA